MALEGTVQDAPPGSLGFDANTVLGRAIARQFFAGGFKFCLSHLSRSTEPPGDLGVQEAEDILSSGLALMPVQHVVYAIMVLILIVGLLLGPVIGGLLLLAKGSVLSPFIYSHS